MKWIIILIVALLVSSCCSMRQVRALQVAAYSSGYARATAINFEEIDNLIDSLENAVLANCQNDVTEIIGKWRTKPMLVEVTYEHQMIPEKDTLIVKHYHHVNGKFYAILPDSTEIWADNIKEIQQ